MDNYLVSTEVIDWEHPLVLEKAKELARGLVNPEGIAKACFEYVRDEIKHSESEVLEHKTGYCYAKAIFWQPC